MLKLKGISVSSGIVEGSIFIKHNSKTLIQKNITKDIDIEKEIKQYHNIIQDLHKDFLQLKWQHEEFANLTNKQMIDLYTVILKDPIFTEQIPQLIQEEKITAQLAVSKRLKNLEYQFAALDNEYFKARFADFRSIGDQILDKLIGNKGFSEINEPVIIAAYSFSPAELLQIPRELILGMLSEQISTNSHAGILAESLRIPAIFGVEGLLSAIQHRSRAILDTYKGIVILNPTTEISSYYQKMLDKHLDYEENIYNATKNASTTKDGCPINVLANIGEIGDVQSVDDNNADGVGLLRTEIQALAKGRILEEEEQFSQYKAIMIAMKNKPIVIRTLDLGGDKVFTALEGKSKKELNPFLGYRSTRRFIQEPKYIKHQFRALIKASEYNTNMKILIPFVSTLEDIVILKEVFHECCYEIYGNQIPHQIPFGMMAEIPSVILCLEDFIPYIDFVSIGTNDLTQYTLAVDRNNSRVQNYFQLSHPSILKLIALTIEKTDPHKIPVSVCGEIAKEPIYARLLLGMGVHSLSMTPSFIPMIKYILINSTVKECKELWSKVSHINNTREINDFLTEDLIKFLKKHDAYFSEDWVCLNKKNS